MSRVVVPNIPAPVATSGPDRTWQQAVRDILEVRSGFRSQAQAYRWVTKSELDLMLVDLQGTVKDLVKELDNTAVATGDPVSPPTNLAVGEGSIGAFAIRLTWTNASDDRVAATEIWVATSPSRSDAYRLAVVPLPSCEFTYIPLRVTADHWFWIRHVATGGVDPSIWEPSDYQGGYLVEGSKTVGETIESIMGVLTGQITESQLYQDLNGRINKIDRNFGFMDALFNEHFQGGIGESVQVLFSKVWHNEQQGIYLANTLKTMSDNTTVMAQEIDAMGVRLGNTTAAIQEERQVRATADKAMASQVTTLQSTVGDYAAAVQISAETINGLSGQYTVKIDNNGYVTGYGLASTTVDGTPTSEFIVLVDSFKIVTPGATPTVPFAVGQVNGVSTVGINGQLIVDGSIMARSLSTDALSVGGNVTIQDGAIAIGRIGAPGGISWDSGLDMTGKPAGLYLTSHFLGFFNGTGWNNSTYIGSDGKVQLVGDSANLFIKSIGGDYQVALTAGDIVFSYIHDGIVHPYNSLKRLESGSAGNGTEVTIPGLFKTQPKIMVSPRTLKSYSGIHPACDQTLQVGVENITSFGTNNMQWKFTPMATLRVNAGDSEQIFLLGNNNWEGSIPPPPDQWTAVYPTDNLPPGSRQLTVNIQSKGYVQGFREHSDANDAYYYYSFMDWTVRLSVKLGSSWLDNVASVSFNNSDPEMMHAAILVSPTYEIDIREFKLQFDVTDYDACSEARCSFRHYWQVLNVISYRVHNASVQQLASGTVNWIAIGE